MALPMATERVSHGEFTWFVNDKKTFVQSWDHHHVKPGERGRNGFVCPAPAGVQAEMIEDAPDRFFCPPYVGGKGWLGVYVDLDDVDWDEIAAIIADAYRCVAPATLIDLI
jgi:hypothetical protein